MPNTYHHRLLILGSGPAGYTAAIYAGRANLAPALITGMEQGGQLTKTHAIDNWPGEHDGILGTDLMTKMAAQAQRFDSKIIFDNITKTDLQQRPFILQGDNDNYSCDALIIATGATAKYLGLPSEQKYIGRGVSACAICDGFFYKNKKVIVVGGGNTAADDALYLAKLASEVIIVHRRDQLRAEPIMAAQLHNAANIKFVWNSIVDEVLGDEHGVTGLRVKNVQTQATTEIAAQGIFIAIGHKPNTDPFIGQLTMQDEGYIKIYGGFAGNVTATNIPGVFAAGDVADPIYRQAVTAAASGCMAALDAKKYLDQFAQV